MPTCKKCGSERAAKSGMVAGKQRFCCKDCGCNFREGDNRTSSAVAAKKALLLLSYAMGKGSYRMLRRIFGIGHALVYRWIRAFGEGLPEPEVPGGIAEMEFDEMWHFVRSKKTSFGSSRPLTVAHGRPWPGCSAVVMLQHSGGSTRK